MLPKTISMSDSDCPIEFGFMVLSVSLTVRVPVPSVISAVPATGPSVPEPVPVKTAADAGAALSKIVAPVTTKADRKFVILIGDAPIPKKEGPRFFPAIVAFGLSFCVHTLNKVNAHINVG